MPEVLWSCRLFLPYAIRSLMFISEMGACVVIFSQKTEPKNLLNNTVRN